MNRKIKILLALSLCANILLAGFLLGQGGKAFMPRHAVERSEYVSARMKEFKQANRQLGDAISAERTKVMDMLGEDKINMEEYRMQVEKVNRLQGEMFLKVSEEMADILQSMPHEEKAKALEGFRRRFKKR